MVIEENQFGQLAVLRQLFNRFVKGFGRLDESAVPIFFHQCTEPSIRLFMIAVRRRAQGFRGKDFGALIGEFSELGHPFREHQLGTFEQQDLIACIKPLTFVCHPNQPLVINRKIVQRCHAAQIKIESGDFVHINRLSTVEKRIKSALVAIENKHIGLIGARLHQKLAPGNIIHPSARLEEPGIVAMKTAAIRPKRHARLNRIVEGLVCEGVKIVAIDSTGEGSVAPFFKIRGMCGPISPQTGECLGAYNRIA